MQRVSTAFVGQVSAARSLAIAKLKGRARATNDPAYVPLASSHRAQSRRRRDLVAIFLDALGGRVAVSELQLVQVLKAAELTTSAEAVRARVLAGDGPLSCSSRSRAKQGARFERSTSRPPPSATFAEVVARIAAEEALGGPEPYTSGTRPYPSKPSKSGFEGFEGADP
jgi:hypothetical protein